MPASTRIHRFLRRNVLGLVAIYIALGGAAYAGVTANSVGTKHLKRGAVTPPKIAGGAVKTPKIAGGAVKTPKIAANAVKAAKVADGSLTGADVLNGSLGTADLANAAVTNAQLAGNAVTSAKVADSSLSGADILNGSIGLADLAGNSVNSAKVVNSSLTGADIQNGSVGIAKLADVHNSGRVTLSDPAPGDNAASEQILLVDGSFTVRGSCGQNVPFAGGDDLAGITVAGPANSSWSSMMSDGTQSNLPAIPATAFLATSSGNIVRSVSFFGVAPNGEAISGSASFEVNDGFAGSNICRIAATAIGS